MAYHPTGVVGDLVGTGLPTTLNKINSNLRFAIDCSKIFFYNKNRERMFLTLLPRGVLRMTYIDYLKASITAVIKETTDIEVLASVHSILMNALSKATSEEIQVD